ncbi:TlpA disulfide reductase family protein [Vitiosangium sp. GDMCC 1.1324]|uniref:TlpA disulfide reductase family protein n=1 Tax=Vitiosangium sp. (strain GDMCC 1.1324) TaxID=2138576 RepID=UPI000D342C97|nr:TlpA disulfide reductase family protein [Vitiosangium sp. GDMCC 1.1324]PTL79005.1 TlpA family protein disulfide reductase [Vitiosangium sp. GDMCC 1.1324]
MSSLDVPLTLLDPEGGWIYAPLHVHDLHGKPVLLHFWNELDETSQEQLPRLKTLLDEFLPKGLMAIGVHVPVPKEDLGHALDTNDIEATVKRLGFSHPVAVDDGSMAAAYGVEGLPAYLVYDAFGILRLRVSGADAMSVELRRILARLTGPEATTGAFAP